MASSGSTDFTATRNDIIRQAALKVGAISAGVTMGAQMASDFAFNLNGLVKRWQAASIHIWTTREATLFPQPNQIKYEVGSGATDHVTESYAATEISADEASGQTTLSVAATDDITANDNIGVVLDDGTIQWSTVSSKTSTTVTIADALTDSAAEGNPVYTYTTRIVRPLRIVDARRFNVVNAVDTPVIVSARLDYQRLPNKTQTGMLNQVFYDPQLTRGHIYIWQAPTAVSDLLKFTWHRPIEDFDAAGDNPDLPQEWIDALVWNLAWVMAPEFEVSAQRYQQIRELAAITLDTVKDFDREPESVFFQPDASLY